LGCNDQAAGKLVAPSMGLTMTGGPPLTGTCTMLPANYEKFILLVKLAKMNRKHYDLLFFKYLFGLYI
jgi:hypothetical protein